MLCDRSSSALTESDLACVIDAVHNFCYLGKDAAKNKEDIIHHYYRPLRRTLMDLCGSGHGLTVRRSANTLITLLNIRVDHGEDGGGPSQKE